jgi:hypothetical protein
LFVYKAINPTDFYCFAKNAIVKQNANIQQIKRTVENDEKYEKYEKYKHGGVSAPNAHCG